MPLARASPANCCFQPSKPAAELPHWAAWACGLAHASMARIAKVAVVNPLISVIRKPPCLIRSSRGVARQRASRLDLSSQPARRGVVTVRPGGRAILQKYACEVGGIAQWLNH